MYVCICTPTTEELIRDLVRKGNSASSIKRILFQRGVGSGCGTCRNSIGQIINRIQKEEGVF